MNGAGSGNVGLFMANNTSIQNMTLSQLNGGIYILGVQNGALRNVTITTTIGNPVLIAASNNVMLTNVNASTTWGGSDGLLIDGSNNPMQNIVVNGGQFQGDIGLLFNQIQMSGFTINNTSIVGNTYGVRFDTSIVTGLSGSGNTISGATVCSNNASSITGSIGYGSSTCP